MIVVIMNYNSWFHNQHRYRTGIRDGHTSFNDTKWVNINDRHKILTDLQSELLTQQPFSVIGNNNGFDKLIDLMGRSNYTFEDINESLTDTYRMSLQNAMSRNLVNTHAVMFHCSNTDSKNVTPDKFTHYWIIDAPFNQLHFGHRDEFIRQKLHEMHNIANGNYVDISTFTSSEFSKILGFTIICTVNGYFCNDCKIAVDDKGFKFKIGWPYSSDVEFIVYKLDESNIYRCEVPSTNIYNSTIPYSLLNRVSSDMIGKKCIINIYDKRFIKTSPSVPNFGIFTDKGLEIRNIQQATIKTIERQSTTTVTLDIYVIKYIHEVPDIYPAVNYYDIIDSHRVYTERHENVTNHKGEKIVASSSKNINNLEICTPPIALDRDVHYSFQTIVSCISMRTNLMRYETDIKTVGNHLMSESYSIENFIKIDKPLLDEIYNGLLSSFKTYQQGAILTSLVPSNMVDKFSTLVNSINSLRNVTNFEDIQKYAIDELYESNYKLTVDQLTTPFRDNALSNFQDIKLVSNNYFTSNNETRFNRPIAEQNFITLRYHKDDECWLFDNPTIKHFHGIGNTFYIDSNLNGDELFKFFVLYTDTEGPSTENIDHFDIETVLDFDKFYDEVDRHMGCIRFWDAENRLMKMSKALYGKYDDETCVQIFSKILKRKLSGDSLLKIYPSDINYEQSNVTSDNWMLYNENSERAPFAINFLFYTLSMLNNNEDKLQSYFYRHLVNQKYNNRYTDIEISSILDDERYPINYSNYTIAPVFLPDDFERPIATASIYYGLPLLLDRNGVNIYDPYRYVFNVYDPEIKYPMISNNDVNPEYYVRYDDISKCGGKIISYKDDINMGRLATLYLSSMYDYISELQTNYKTSFNQTSIIESGIETINRHIETISRFASNASFSDVEGFSNTEDIVNLIVDDNAFISHINNIKSIINHISTITFNGRNVSIIEFFNKLLSSLRQVYVTTGLDNYIVNRTKMLYIHLKKINTTMNPYEYREWIDNIDLDLLRRLDGMLAKNENYSLGDQLFIRYAETLNNYINTRKMVIIELDDQIKNISSILYTIHIEPIVNFCNDIINHYIFNVYTIHNIEYDSSIRYSTLPAYISIEIPESDHINPPIGEHTSGSKYILFQPITDEIDSQYIISSISNVCEYVFFNGDKLENITMNILDSTGAVITTQQVSISFIKIGTSADRVNTFNQLLNMRTTAIDFENTHESFEVVNGLIVNEKHADMNYEMLLGNCFTPLNHEIELVLKPDTWLQGSVDRIHISNQHMNRLSSIDFGHKTCTNVFFKPVQVMHIKTNDDGSIDSIGGKYFEGQKLYLTTEDGLTTFPVVVTSVDHSMNKGFIEARVDGWNSKWFKVTDQETITKYLTTEVTCSVVDDNIRNFLDEFNNPEFTNSLDITISDEEINSVNELPGDPLFVSNNPEFVYNRLNWFFNELVPNRFIDEDHKTHKFIYITSGFINNSNDELKINMINHNMNNLTIPEQYPVLRDEPNDHDIWLAEIATFKDEQYRTKILCDDIIKNRKMAEHELNKAETVYSREYWIGVIDEYDRKIQQYEEYMKRLELYIRQLETPTTWFNVRSYDATLVYIANGRADQFSPAVVSNIRDLLYTDKLDVFLYDWEHKVWLDPSTYSISSEIINSIKINECDDYKTNRVLYSITIKPNEGFNFSKKLLVYFSYDKSDIFDDIPMNQNTCSVKFKPVLSLDNEIVDYDPYSNIRIRKHFDGFEKYKFDQEEINDGIHIKRVKRSGKYTYSPTFRVCDIKFTDMNGDHTYEDIDNFFVPNPFPDASTDRSFIKQKFETKINTKIDAFVPNTNIKLICITNNKNSSYDGNISNIMFNAITSNVDGVPKVTIVDSTLPNFVTGSFICSVFKDDSYKPCGGVITVNVTSSSNDVYNDKWILIPKEFMKYRELPDEFMFTTITPITNGGVTVTLENKYSKETNDSISIDNSDLNNPFEYYYDTLNKTRLPISDTRINSHKQRLVVDTDINTNIKVIKAPYIGICRYSVQKVPKDGFIDLTGYIPTPLSRDRYEFWINGRCINSKDITILSPTSIQLCNMKSLRNFEVIELVDDVDSDSELMYNGNVYVDMNGNSYSSYRLALLSNTRIRNQNIMFAFNTNNHKNIHDYSKSIITNPNNQDIENDILDSLSFEENVTDYNKLYNIPTINGISLFHPKLTGLGITEIPNEKIIEEFDKTWKLEILTNPLFPTTHRNIGNIDKTSLKLHVKKLLDPHWNGLTIDTSGMFLLYASGPVEKFFTYYISKLENGEIDDVRNTMKIIPFITSGVYVLIDAEFEGMWLHSTYGDTKPIHIIE